jgi:tRNA threonylcarbamoyladenosine modification (KEOPS) complex  Pcc1 subunit
MHLPPDSNILKFNGITYLGNRFSLEIKKSSSKIVFRAINQEKQIQVTKKSTGIIYRPAVGMEIEINNQDSLKFESSISTFGECKMKETKLGTPGNGTEKIYYSSILVLMLFIIKNII